MYINRKKILKYWLVFLLLSFAYEKPLFILSNIDRINPRLFDVVTLLGFLVIPYTRQRGKVNEVFKKWSHVVLWFGICCLFTIVFYGFTEIANSYSIFYYIKYLQELFVLFVAARILSEGVDIELVLKSFVVSGLFMFLYAYYELNFGTFGELEYAPGKYTIKPEGVVWGPFGNTYFQIANYIPLVFILIFAFASIKRGVKRNLYLFIALLCAWPLLYTGSRTGIGLLVLTFVIYIFFKVKSIKFHYIVIILLGLIIFDNLPTENKSESIKTIERLDAMEDHDENSISARFLLFLDFDIFAYEKGGDYLPYFGGGFYVAPINGYYRIGYGFHNIYMFAIEQSGLIGLVLFLLFLKKAVSSVKKKMSYYKNKNPLAHAFTIAVFSFLIAEIILGIAGHTFWRGFATNNINGLRILILIIATSPILLPKLMRNE